MYHNNFELRYKDPFGAVAEDTKVKFRIDTEIEYESCTLRLWTARQNELKFDMEYIDNGYEVSVKIKEKGLNWYFFILKEANGREIYYGTKNGLTAGEGQVFYNTPNDNSFQITCYDKDFKVPEWFKGRIMYQIFPDRFNRNKDYKFDTSKYKLIHEDWTEHLGCTRWGADNFEYYAGNIKGIIDKIDYIKQLGIGVIYLNPIFKARSNHRYDVSTYMEIDEMLGLPSDFKEFVDICHDNDIKVIIDVSWNHTGDDSVYFNKYKTFGLDGAFNNPNSNYRSWYNIYDNGQYDCWWNFDSLPTLNKNDVSYRTHVQEVVHKWVSYGIDGFRLDVIDELPDGFLKWFRDILKAENENLVVFGEVWDDPTLKKDGYGKFRSYLYGNSQDSVMNYELRNLIVSFLAYGVGEKEVYHTNLNSEEFANKCMNLISNFPKDSFYSAMNFLSTHDINRIITALGDAPWVDSMSKPQQGHYKLPQEKYDLAVKRFKLAWLFMCFMPGNPSLYYGDEIGMQGYNDPYNRKPMRWDNMDHELLDWIISANMLRNKEEVLKYGDVKLIHSNDDVVGVVRTYKNKREICFINRSNENKFIMFDGEQLEINALSYLIIS